MTMTDEQIREHIARMNALRKQFASFWQKHFEHKFRGSALARSEAMIREWNAYRKAMQ